jgi:hypothetical protein
MNGIKTRKIEVVQPVETHICAGCKNTIVGPGQQLSGERFHYNKKCWLMFIERNKRPSLQW